MDAATIRELRVRSGHDGTLLVFATVPRIERVELDAFRPSAEVSELVIVSGPCDDVVFPLDAEVVIAHSDRTFWRCTQAPGAARRFPVK